MNETMILIICFFVGMILGGIILILTVKNAKKRFDETIEKNEEEWDNKEDENENEK